MVGVARELAWLLWGLFCLVGSALTVYYLLT